MELGLHRVSAISASSKRKERKERMIMSGKVLMFVVALVVAALVVPAGAGVK